MTRRRGTLLKGRTGETTTGDGVRIWAGCIADAFYIDLSLLGIVNGAIKNGGAVDLSGWRPEDARQQLRQYHGRVDRARDLAPSPAPAPWRARRRLGYHQTRHGCRGLAADQPRWPPHDVADLLARRHRLLQPCQHPAPVRGLGPRGEYIAGQIAAVVAASGTSDDPRGYGQTVARHLFPDVLPYVIGTPATYGFAAFNGRTRADNAPEAMLSLVTNMAIPSGLTPAVASHLRDNRFPYVVPASPARDAREAAA